MIGSILAALRRITASFLFRRDYSGFMKSPSRRTQMTAQALLRNAFVQTRGKSTRWAHDWQKSVSPYTPCAAQSKLFPQCNADDIAAAVVALRTAGFHVLPYRLPSEWVEAVKTMMAGMRVGNRSDQNDRQTLAEIVPRGPTYWHSQSDLANVPELRSFVSDPVLREIAARYLECAPVFDFATAWWSFPSSTGTADSASAQLYHFDMDRVRWVKVFCYLTDVGEENGPHAFVTGSHNAIQQIVTHDGRYSDEEVFAHFPRSSEVRVTGPAGTVFLEDTLGFHKGVPVREGRRGVFEFEYSINHYGYPHEGAWC